MWKEKLVVVVVVGRVRKKKKGSEDIQKRKRVGEKRIKREKNLKNVKKENGAEDKMEVKERKRMQWEFGIKAKKKKKMGRK